MMNFTALSDSAVLAQFTSDSDASEKLYALTTALDRDVLAGVTDIVPAFTTVAVFYDPARVLSEQSDSSAYQRVCHWISARAGTVKKPASRERRLVEIPVCYGGEFGPDLNEIAIRAERTVDDVVRLHTQPTYDVGAVGFAPGFPYLRGLPPELHTPRRVTPRTRVPAGSVGIGGAQTGIYSLETPGGWNLIGRTPKRLFLPECDPPTLLRVGDRVRFRSISPEHFTALHEKRSFPAARSADHGSPAELEVLRAGGLTTIQDLGRTGFQRFGISVGGSVDRFASRVANLLVGNPEEAAVLECSLTGPNVQFTHETLIAVTGAEVEGVVEWRRVRVRSGEVLSLAKFVRGARAYLAVAGGLDVPLVMGSRATYLAAQIGGVEGRSLRAGDRLPLPALAAPLPDGVSDHWQVATSARPKYSATPIVRVIKGPQWDWFRAASLRVLSRERFRISVQSDRMGLRLEGPPLKLQSAREMVSEAVAFGSIQVPPDGQPIVLLADRQTIGGYPKIAAVISVDLPLLAQLRPGDQVRFSEVSLAQAESVYLAQERALTVLRLGIAFHAA